MNLYQNPSELVLTTVSLFSSGTFDSCLAGLGNNQVYSTFGSAKTAKNYSKAEDRH